MTIEIYMDAHIPRAIPDGLRLRDVNVITAQEDEADGLSDSSLLDRANELKRVVFTFDDDFLTEATKRQRQNHPFNGVIYAHPLRISIGKCIEDLELIAKVGEPEDLRNCIVFLPL